MSLLFSSSELPLLIKLIIPEILLKIMNLHILRKYVLIYESKPIIISVNPMIENSNLRIFVSSECMTVRDAYTQV